MALTAFPTITFNSSTGSNSAASGAGPATAITGTCAASTNSTTVTFNASPDLSGVAQDGSHVLWVNGIGFVRISTVDNSAKTCVVETALTIGAGTAFAIGGKRATLDETESRRLFAATSSPTASGASGQWTISLEDDQTLTSAIALSCTAGSGEIRVSSSSDTVSRNITQSANANLFSANTANRWAFCRIQFRQSHATKSDAFTIGASVNLFFENSIAGSQDGINCPLGLMTRTAGSPIINLSQCSVIRCSGNGINLPSGLIVCSISGSLITRNGGIGISGTAPVIRLTQSIISHNAGDGIAISTGVSATIDQCTIDGNAGDGIEFVANNVGCGLEIKNCQITNNGASGTQYGLNLSGATPHTIVIRNCNFYGNRTAAANGITLDATNITVDPGYADRTNTVQNYAVGTAMKAAGFPASTATIGAGQSGTTAYVDIGAAQRQESGGIIRTGMNGGFL